jgi:hypothetical protein
MSGGKAMLTDGRFGTSLQQVVDNGWSDWVRWIVNKDVGPYVYIYFKFPKHYLVKTITVNILSDIIFELPSSYIHKNMTLQMTKGDNYTVERWKGQNFTKTFKQSSAGKRGQSHNLTYNVDNNFPATTARLTFKSRVISNDELVCCRSRATVSVKKEG